MTQRRDCPSAFCWLAVMSWALAGHGAEPGDSPPPWIGAMRAVHARFHGRPGTFAHFGDSITVTMAYWSPLQYMVKNASPQLQTALTLVKGYMQRECWQDWKGAKYGSEGGMTIAWAEKNVDQWLYDLNPETVLIMFGTNDLGSVNLEQYKATYRIVIQKCLHNGSVVITSTIPPQHRWGQKGESFVQAVRDLAAEMKLPLIDFYAEIARRRPNDWDGAGEQFSQYMGYDVPTLIGRDGVHPSSPQQYRGDFSEAALRSSGYGLRSYLTLLAYAEVLQRLGLAQGPPVHGGLTLSDGSLPRIAAPQERPAPKGGSQHGKGDVAPHNTRKAASGAGKSNPSEPLLNPPWQPWFHKAPPLPPPTGSVVRVSTSHALAEACAQAQPGTTILVKDGIYPLDGRRLELRAENVTLRSESGQPQHVVIEGNGIGEALAISSGSVTVADMAIQNVKWNGIKFNSQLGIHHITIRNCILHNIWERAIKGVTVPVDQLATMAPSGYRIEYCLFYNDHPKRHSDDPEDKFGDNYLGGIDAMAARNWTLCDNAFIGIQGKTREGRGAIFLWRSSRGCVIERNVFIDCDQGICLGNAMRHEDTRVHCEGFLVRNNFVTRCPEGGIFAAWTKDCKIINNTVYDPQSRLRRLIRVVDDDDGLLLANNLLSGPPLTNQSPSHIELTHNLDGDFATVLVDPAHGNLHLTPAATRAIHQAIAHPAVTDAFDGQPRGPRPDIGADELKAP